MLLSSSYLAALNNPGQSVPITSDGASPVSRFIEALVFEVSEAAVHCAVISSCYNGLVTGTTREDLRKTLVWAPRKPAILEIIRQNMEPSPAVTLDSHAIKAIESMFAECARAAHQLELLFQEAAKIGEHRAIVVYLERVRADWQNVCAYARRAIESMTRSIKLLPVSTDLGIPLHVATILTEAEVGGWPCLGSNGLALFKTARQQRNRRNQQIRCTIRTNSGLFSGRTIDISLTGLGLQCGNVILYGPVTITLENGRQLFGSITWQEGNRLGIKFSQPLLDNDPLLL